MSILRHFLPSVGRMSPSQAAEFGRNLDAGAGYVGWGSVVVLFNLPERFRKLDPLPPSIAELNASLGRWLEDFSEIFPPR